MLIALFPSMSTSFQSPFVLSSLLLLHLPLPFPHHQICISLADLENDVVHLLDSYSDFHLRHTKLRTIHSILDLTTLISYLFAGGNSLNAYSLKRMGVLLMSCDLLKVNKVRCSNWEIRPLTSAQLEYAALDGRVALDMVEECIRLGILKEIGMNHIWEDEIEAGRKESVTSSEVGDIVKSVEALTLTVSEGKTVREEGEVGGKREREEGEGEKVNGEVNEIKKEREIERESSSESQQTMSCGVNNSQRYTLFPHAARLFASLLSTLNTTPSSASSSASKGKLSPVKV